MGTYPATPGGLKSLMDCWLASGQFSSPICYGHGSAMDYITDGLCQSITTPHQLWPMRTNSRSNKLCLGLGRFEMLVKNLSVVLLVLWGCLLGLFREPVGFPAWVDPRFSFYDFSMNTQHLVRTTNMKSVTRGRRTRDTSLWSRSREISRSAFGNLDLGFQDAY